jgi:hypothetical protein
MRKQEDHLKKIDAVLHDRSRSPVASISSVEVSSAKHAKPKKPNFWRMVHVQQKAERQKQKAEVKQPLQSEKKMARKQKKKATLSPSSSSVAAVSSSSAVASVVPETLSPEQWAAALAALFARGPAPRATNLTTMLMIIAIVFIACIPGAEAASVEGLQLPDFIFSNSFLPFLSCFFLIPFVGVGNMVAGPLAAMCEAVMPLIGFVFHCFAALFSLISAFFAGSDLHLINFIVFFLLYVVACFWPHLLAKEA